MRFSCLLLAVATVSASAQSAPRKQLVEDLRLDSNTEDLPGIFRTAIGPRGQIALFIREDQNLRIYDSTGKKLATFGRAGAGPRESRFVASLRWRGDTVWMYDRALRRMTWVTQNGEFLRHEPIPQNLNLRSVADDGRDPVGAFYVFDPQSITPDGRIVAWADVGLGRDANGRVQTKSSLVLADLTGGNRKIIGAQEPALHVSVRIVDQTDTVRSFGLPFTTFPVLTHSTDGTRFGSVTHELGPRSGSYTVRVFRTNGDTMFMKTFPFTGMPIPTAKRDSAIERQRNPRYAPSVNARLLALARDSTPRIYSRVVDVALGRQNTTWLTMRDVGRGTEAIALDARGNPILSVMLPARTRIIDGSPTSLWVIQTDEDDLPSVVRYKIR